MQESQNMITVGTPPEVESEELAPPPMPHANIDVVTLDPNENMPEEESAFSPTSRV